MLLVKQIKRTRQKAFLSQKAFANVLGISVSAINKWKNRKCWSSLSVMKEIKTFCVGRSLSYDELEETWFDFDGKNEE